MPVYPYLAGGFMILTLVTTWLVYRILGSNKLLLAALLLWLIVHGVLAHLGFYALTDTLPPRVALALVPMIITGAVIGFTPWGKALRRTVNLEHLHYLHAVRIAVEGIFLHRLYELGYVAKVFTYEGQNWDIIAGLTGPVIALLVFRYRKIPRWVATAWNVAGITLLGWTISRAVLSAPSGYQQFGLGQPTVAIFYFPYIWLPALVAPVMFWAHFIAIERLAKEER